MPEWAAGTFLGDLPAATAAELVRASRTVRYRPGQMILREGASDTHVVLILSGFVKATTAVEGVETLLGIRLPGEVIGEIGALMGEPRTATVVACGRVVAGLLGKPDLDAFLLRHPRAYQLVTAVVARQLRWANRRRADFVAFPAHIRLARLLVEIADVCGRPFADGTVEIGVPLTQPELATMIAIAQATVEKAVHELRDLGLISTGYRKVTILDPVRLRALADGTPA